jgi:thioredoxin-like negative regulator of GroEL
MADRVEMLMQLVAEHPEEAMPRYGLAMEYMARGQFADAARQFEALREKNPGYIAAYQQGAQALINAERFDEARAVLADGISRANRGGNNHAASEMQGMLDELG